MIKGIGAMVIPPNFKPAVAASTVALVLLASQFGCDSAAAGSADLARDRTKRKGGTSQINKICPLLKGSQRNFCHFGVLKDLQDDDLGLPL